MFQPHGCPIDFISLAINVSRIGLLCNSMVVLLFSGLPTCLLFSQPSLFLPLSLHLLLSYIMAFLDRSVCSQFGLWQYEAAIHIVRLLVHAQYGMLWLEAIHLWSQADRCLSQPRYPRSFNMRQQTGIARHMLGHGVLTLIGLILLLDWFSLVQLCCLPRLDFRSPLDCPPSS